MLRLRAPFIPGETATSYCSRLAVSNRCRSIEEFCLDIGVPLRDVVAGTHDSLSRLARLGGIDFTPMWSSAIRSRERGYVCGDNLIDPKLRRSTDELLVCPACIASDLATWGDVSGPSDRTTWYLKPIMTCVEHQMELLVADRKPQTDLWTLGKRHDFARRIQSFVQDIGNHAASARRRPATRLERYLTGRINGTPLEANEIADCLPFYAVAQASLALGAFIDHGPKIGLKTLSDDQQRAAGATGFAILAAGHKSLQASLREGMDRWPKGKAASKVRAFFGTFHAWLLYRNDDASYEVLRNAIREIMISSRAMQPGETIYGIAPGARRLQSVLMASRETGKHPKRLQKALVATGVLDKKAAKVSAHKAAFPTDSDAAEILDRITRCIPKTAARQYINAPRTQFDLLHRSGFIVPFVKPGDTLIRYGFDTLDLDGFLQRLFAHVRDPGADAATYFPIPDAARRALCSAMTVVQMILDGRLKRIYRLPGAEGYMSVLVDLAEIQAVLARPERPGLSIKQVEKKMRWTSRVINALVENALLPASVIINPISKAPQTIIEPSDLTEFDNTYVALSVLARELGSSLRGMKKGLEGLGIGPAFDPRTIGASFYRRADLRHLR